MNNNRDFEYLCSIFGLSPDISEVPYIETTLVTKTYRFTKGKLRGTVEVINSKIVTIDLVSIDEDFNLIYHNNKDNTSLLDFFKNIYDNTTHT